MPVAQCVPWYRSKPPSAQATPSTSASAGSKSLLVISGGARGASPPESISQCSARHDGFPGLLPVGASRNDRERVALLQMLGEERHAARPGDVGAGFVVARALVAMEAVLSVRVDEDLDVRTLALDGLD